MHNRLAHFPGLARWSSDLVHDRAVAPFVRRHTWA